MLPRKKGYSKSVYNLICCNEIEGLLARLSFELSSSCLIPPNWANSFPVGEPNDLHHNSLHLPTTSIASNAPTSAKGRPMDHARCPQKIMIQTSYRNSAEPFQYRGFLRSQYGDTLAPCMASCVEKQPCAKMRMLSALGALDE